ncbi:hypothetical protein FO519_002993 [Halicephalobus sp. NKZ332]|nr:hypothetical protein FO519_002993 [Halicephalobus sp. NKZ332]
MASTFGNGDEYGLRQKLTVMENAVSQIGAVKAQLRTNAEIARKEISNAIGYQLSLVRAREQFLLRTLESMVDSKERVLCEQQEQLNQAIGACQQSMECALRGNSENPSVPGMLFRLNVMDLRPRMNSHLVFKCDPSDMRRAIYNFGQVVSDPSVKDRADCFPLDVDDFEDGAFLAHKSVHRIPPMNSDFPESDPNSVNDWLSHVKAVRTDSDSDGFEVVRNRMNSESASSIEIISKGDRENDFETLENLRLPMDQWLQKPNPKNNQNLLPQNILPGLKRGSPKSDQVIEETIRYLTQQFSNQPFGEPVEKKKRKSVDETRDFEFGNVISSIVSSKSDEWLSRDNKESDFVNPLVDQFLSMWSKKQETTSIDTTVNSDITITEDKMEEKDASYCPYYEKMMDHLKTNFPEKKSFWLKESPKCDDRPINSMPPDLGSWEPVLGWKGFLEKLHASGEDDWLVASSRELKSGQTS